MNFYEIYKRKGTSATLFALYSAKNYGCTLPEFFERLEFVENSYYNAFFRVKNDLLSLGLIEFKKNRNKEKVIRLTSKGIKIVRILKEIRILFDQDYEVIEK